MSVQSAQLPESDWVCQPERQEEEEHLRHKHLHFTFSVQVDGGSLLNVVKLIKVAIMDICHDNNGSKDRV